MPAGVTVKLRGLKEMEAALKEFAEQVGGRAAKAALKRALVQAAQPMAQAMEDGAPIRSGGLSQSIVISANGAGIRGKQAYASAKRGGASDAEALKVRRDAQRGGPAVIVLVGPDKRHSGVASQVEFGTRPHAILPKRGQVLQVWSGGQVVAVARKIDHPGAAPHPFLRPAFEATAPAVLDALKPLLAEQIRKGAERARRRALKRGA